MGEKYTDDDFIRIAEDLIEDLRECEDGTNIATWQLLKLAGYDIDEFETFDLIDIHNALFRAAKANHITLDMSAHYGKEEGLPFDLHYMEGLILRGNEQLSRFETRTVELGVASMVFEEMLSGKLGDQYRIKINGKEDFKQVIKSIANSDAVKGVVAKKMTGNKVKELISAESIRNIANQVTKEKSPKQIAPKKQVKMFRLAAM